MFIKFFISISTILIWIIIYQYMRKMNIEYDIKRVQIRKDIEPILISEINRIWLIFFQSFLLVHVTSDSTPSEKEFLEYRKNFVDMFENVIGQVQVDLYVTVFGDLQSFRLFIMHKFEEQFNLQFLEAIGINDINDDSVDKNNDYAKLSHKVVGQ